MLQVQQVDNPPGTVVVVITVTGVKSAEVLPLFLFHKEYLQMAHLIIGLPTSKIMPKCPYPIHKLVVMEGFPANQFPVLLARNSMASQEAMD